jgi:hypothetical protein
MYNDPEWANADEWDAYAWFGFAISEAQTVERLLLLIAMSLRSEELSNDQHQTSRPDPQQELARWTLGRLSNYVTPFGVLACDIVDMLNRAVATRNVLAHEFFVTDIGNAEEESSIGAKEKLQTAASLFSHLSFRLESVLWPLIERSDAHA